MEYVAFLRGINVGGHRSIKMADLEAAFRSLGFQNVRTVLASGNVIFESLKSGQDALVQRIRRKLETELERKTEVILRPLSEIRELVKSNPFRAVKLTPNTRLYIMLLADASKTDPGYTYESPQKDMRIFGLSTGEMGAVLILSPGRGTADLMGNLDKEFGRNVTTRNWKTIQKIAESRAPRVPKTRP